MDLIVVFTLLLAFVDCLTFTHGCSNRPDGEYPLCHPLCTGGGYISCVRYTPYLRQCGKKLLYAPETKSCEKSPDYCKPETNAGQSINQLGNQRLHNPCFQAVLTAVANIVFSIYCWNKF